MHRTGILARSCAAAAAALLVSACQHAPPAPHPLAGSDSGAAPAAGCGAPVVPDDARLRPVAALPDPFTFADGRRVATQADWRCRRAELAAQIQHYELGTLPSAPARVAAHMHDGELIVETTVDGRTVSFPVKIRLPVTGHAPYPALIGMGAVTLDNDELEKMGIALISFPNNELAEQKDAGSRGKGKFYELFGHDHAASAMMAWAWGVSRLVDALAATPGAQIDAERLGVTGCSRNGKGAIVAGAFDERIRLTIAQESGNGGASGWRIADAQRAAGQNVQTLRQIVGENVWFTPGFGRFAETATSLPFDQHEVMGLIAPRALLVVENTSMEWLGNQSAWLTSLGARPVWTALGREDAFGISQVGGHPHCQLPASQYRTVNAYARRFLLGDATADTAVIETDGTFDRSLARWIDWRTPTLR
jgi:hypothetical protein